MEMRQEEASIVHDIRRLETMENSILTYTRLDVELNAGQYLLDLGNAGQRFSMQDDTN